MDTSAIVISASCAAAAGFGVMMGARLFPVLMARRRELANLQHADHELINRGACEIVAHTKLRARASSIIGLYRDALRHTDGAFTRAYHVELAPTVFSDDLVIEGRCDTFARMLAARKPVGTIIQFRLTAGIDPGRAIAAHESARDQTGVHREAALLHDGGIAGYQAMADFGCFRQTKLTVWVRVPNPHRRDDDQFIPTFKYEIKTRGLGGVPLALASSWRAASGHQVARRVFDEEAAALVSMFTPPQPLVTADALRLLSVNGSLNFRHTIVSEFVYPDQRRAVKRLDRRIGQVGRSAQSLTGKHRLSPEARVALEDLARLREDLAGGRAALAQVRFFVVVYGEPSRTRAELAASLKDLDRRCEQVISEMRKIPGADADREEPAALRAIYGRALAGEADARKTGLEIIETAHSLAPLIPTESEWEGAPRPHTLFSLPTGKLIGVDLFDRQLIPSPLVLALAAPRGGKSVLLGRLINDILATKAHACVRAVDFGESFGPLVDVLGGRHLRFQPGTDRTINVWDYDGLENGEPPDEIQVGFVVGDLMQLARVAPDDTLAEDILITLAGEVYRNEAPRNRPGAPKHEPRLSHLVDYLSTWPFKGASASRAEELKLALGQYCGHSFLDAPTHPDFAGESPLDVYELDSLDRFPERVRESLAYRAAARALRAIGKLNEDGTRSPTLLVFDEVWKIREKYPRILDVIKRGARTGGKENVVTVLATQAYEDLSSLPDIAKTAGVKFIGKQIGDYSELVEDTGLSLQAAAGIGVIHNAPGSHAQFLLALGSGEDKIVQMIQCDLSPTELWTFTTNPDERNARARVQSLKPEWSLAEVIAWLSLNYPQGLTIAGLVRIDESLIDESLLDNNQITEGNGNV